MTFQRRLKKIMRDRNLRVAGLARQLRRPYTTVREWVLHGREPDSVELKKLDRRLSILERKT